MSDTTLPVNLNLAPAAFSAVWLDYLVKKITTGPYTVSDHAAIRHLGPTQNFVENCLLQFQAKTSKTFLNVREYGALGDGVTDDSAAIQGAIDAANTLGGATVYLGAGTFLINTALVIYEGTQIIGAGRIDTILEYTGAGYALGQSTPETQIYGVRLEGFGITFAAGGLDLNSVSSSIFLNLHLQANVIGTGTCARLQATALDQELDNVFVACHFQSGAIGLQLGTGGANRNKAISCIVEGCSIGISITDGSFNLIQACTLLDCNEGLTITESGGTLSEGNHIDACIFDVTALRHISISTAGIDNTRITNNYFNLAGLSDVNNGTNTFASGNLPLAPPWGVLYSDAAEIDYLGAATFAGGLNVEGDFLPAAASTYDLGSGVAPWLELYVDDAIILNSLAVGGTAEISGTVFPGGNNTYDLGLSGTRWAKAYITNIIATSTIAIDNTAGVADVNAADLVIGTATAGGDEHGMTIFAGSVGKGHIYFGDAGYNIVGGIEYVHGASMNLIAEAVSAMEIRSTYVAITTAVPQLEFGSGGPRIISGSGTPEAVVTADIGSIYMRTDGGAGNSMYVKESGVGNTGWIAK